MDCIVALTPMARTPAWSQAITLISRQILMTHDEWKDGRISSEIWRSWIALLDIIACSTPSAISNRLPSNNLREFLETGIKTLTGGRIKRVKNFLSENFCLTYGDGVSNVNIKDLISFHKSNESVATLTAIHPPERFGVLDISGKYVTEFHEKHRGESSWINGGFFVFEPQIFDYLKEGDSTILERKPLETLASEKKLTAFKHNGFWYPMDTLRDKNYLENLWKNNKAQWKIWE